MQTFPMPATSYLTAFCAGLRGTAVYDVWAETKSDVVRACWHLLDRAERKALTVSLLIV